MIYFKIDFINKLKNIYDIYGKDIDLINWLTYSPSQWFSYDSLWWTSNSLLYQKNKYHIYLIFIGLYFSNKKLLHLIIIFKKSKD